MYLIDFGLTEFDNGRTNIMWSGITLRPADTLFSMYRIGYNKVINPSTGNTSGYTATTEYSGYTISGVTGASATTGNYFDLKGGYLQGFFKLDGYNYELLPPRYNYGITIETLVYLNSGFNSRRSNGCRAFGIRRGKPSQALRRLESKRNFCCSGCIE